MTTSGPRIAVVSPYVVYPSVDHAGGLYLSALIEGLTAAGAEVRLFCPSPGNEHAPLERATVPVHLSGSAFPTGLRRLGRFLRTSGIGPSWDSFVRGLDGEGERFLREADGIDLHWHHALTYAPEVKRWRPDAALVGTAHDLQSEKIARDRQWGPSWVSRMRARLKLPVVRGHERRIVRLLDRVYVFKVEDAARLRGDAASVAVTTPFVEAIEWERPGSDDPPMVVFVGAFAREENREAARWLLDDIMPLVWREEPRAVVRLAGSSPPDWLEDTRSTRVEVTGYLTDMSAAYSRARAVVVPLRRGAGLKFKTVQALAMGLPVVATSVGAEGVDLESHVRLLVRDTPDGIAAALVETLRSPLPSGTSDFADFDAEIRRQFDVWRDLIERT